jgi:aspartyl-tRNA(Asn)/glutamyl-tRNA(Gln) amidotransferase subunit A
LKICIGRAGRNGEAACQLLDVDALLYPTTPCIPPAISETDDVENERKVNLRCLRNTVTVNYYDGCSISLPCHRRGEAPVGLMVSSMNGEDEHLYAVCAAIEVALNNRTGDE